MKRGSVCAMLFLAAVLIMGLHIGMAGAQGVPADLVQWEGSEWQITMTSKGYEFDPIDAAPSGKIRGTVKFWGVMTIVRVSEIDPTPTGEIQITLYEPKKGECVPSTVINGLALNYVAGSGLSFAAEGVDLMGVFTLLARRTLPASRVRWRLSVPTRQRVIRSRPSEST